jgi:hypothetical protein
MSTIQAQTYEDAVAVTASDSVDDPAGPFAGLLVTATGNVSFLTVRGSTVTLTAVAANTEIHIACKRVRTTGTTATVLGLSAMPYKATKAS